MALAGGTRTRSAGGAVKRPGRLRSGRCDESALPAAEVRAGGERAMLAAMIPHEKVEELVNAHAALEEPTTGAIWIHTGAPEVWLVEVIPTMSDDEKVEEPTFFSPGVEFRFPIALIAGNRQSIEAALRRKPELARAVVDGRVMLDLGDAQALVELAREVSRAA